MIRFIAVDLQHDFTRPSGKHYNESRRSVGFVQETLIPFFKEHGYKISEIISDYRQPRPGDLDDSCWPGEDGYVSEIPDDLVNSRWIKCMNSPLYTRENIGLADKKPGYPCVDASGFHTWLRCCASLYPPRDERADIVLFGLTLDCCVLCTAQAIRFEGYNVSVLMDATDIYEGGDREKEEAMERVVSNWAKPLTWAEAQKKVKTEGVMS